MKTFAALTLALSLGAASTPVLAETVQRTDQKIEVAPASSAGPIKMNDDQLDKVTAGQDVNVCVVCANVGVQAQILTNRSMQNLNQTIRFGG